VQLENGLTTLDKSRAISSCFLTPQRKSLA
jgi:hypothetical protein